MKVLLITATYPPSINGNALSVYGLKQKLQDLGHKVLVLAPVNNLSTGKSSDVFRYASIPNPLVKDYPIPLSPITLGSIKKINKFKPDIIHVHHPYHIGFFANILSEQLKIPLVFTYHTNYDFYAKKYFDFLPKDLRNEFLLNNVFDFCKKTDLVIAPSETINKYLKIKLPSQNIVTVQTIVDDLIHSKHSKEKLKKELGLPLDKKVLLIVSRLSKEKNIELAIKAMKALSKNFYLVICGAGMAKKELKLLTQKLNLSRSIKFKGKINRESLGMYYSSADYFINTSKSETQGLNLYEALSFGLPIVSVNSSVSDEWVKKEHGILCENSILALQKSVISINKMNYSNLSTNSYNFSKKYSPEKNTKIIINEYEKLINANLVSQKLLNTGWQSWSVNGSSEKSIFLERNYLPLNKEFLPIDFKLEKLKKPIRGWCSWYAFGRNITEENILSQAGWFKDHREVTVDYLLIDEGYCKWGDWLSSNEKFPHGMNYVYDEIEKSGLKSGVWIAPFLIQKDSELFKKHSDWVTLTNNKPILGIKASPLDKYVFERYILDIRKDEVKKYIFEVFDKLLDGGKIDLIKLDFLFCIYFIPNISHIEAGKFIRDIFKYIKNKYPKVYTIACGAPLVSCVGVVDSMRIGPDTVSPVIERIPFLFKLFNKFRINEVFKNIERRMWTKKYWNLDPDVFVCRENLGFSNDQIYKLGDAIKKCGGNIFLGDDMTKLSKNKIEKFIIPLLKND